MKRILIIGAGRSATSLIHYLLKTCTENVWQVIVADTNIELAAAKTQDYPCAKAEMLDVYDDERREAMVAQSDIVISMLPPMFHVLLASTCLKFRKHLLTASYVSDEMRALDEAAKNAGVILLNECGVDPGLDHMTALREIEAIKQSGGELTRFLSYTGGLIAPESCTNPWGYKFTWNPRNVVLAGQGGITKFLHNKQYKYIPYHRLFSHHERIHVTGLGDFDGYPNRDSVKYKWLYGIEDVHTMVRGTLRKPGFCDAWNVLVDLGMTDDSFTMSQCEGMSYRSFVASFLNQQDGEDLESSFCAHARIEKYSKTFQMLAWLGLFSEEKIQLQNASPATILLHLLKSRWALEPGDKDMVVMQHIFEYTLAGKQWQKRLGIVCIGDDDNHTAMAKTVGWPLAIAAKLILQGKINDTGVLIPIKPSIYSPILEELEQMGLKMVEETVAMS